MKFRENISPRKTYYIYRHQRKADPYVNALKEYGWARCSILKRTSAAFFDIDIMSRVQLFNMLHGYGVKMFLYPHAAMPNVIYAWKDCEPHPYTSAHFVSAEGHKEVMLRLGYQHPIHVVGWGFCPIKPFEPSPEIRTVLFGPIHPNNATKWLHEVDLEANRCAFEGLRKAQKQLGFKLIVRYLYNLEANGLRAGSDDKDIEYVLGQPDNAYRQIDEADLVVSKQTLGYMAVARGKPTLMMSEHIAPKVGDNPNAFEFIRHWEDISELMMYPLDINSAGDVSSLMLRAAATDEDIRQWRTRMIGDQFDNKMFIDALEGYFSK